RRFVKAREEDRGTDASVFRLLDDYEQLTVSTDDKASLDCLKTDYSLAGEELKPLTLLVLKADGSVVATKKWPLDLSTDTDALQADLQEFAAPHALPRPDARELLSAALDRARREDKLVLLEESGTYCGWCRVLARLFDRHPNIFEANFVPLRMDRSRFTYGE